MEEDRARGGRARRRGNEEGEGEGEAEAEGAAEGEREQRVQEEARGQEEPGGGRGGEGMGAGMGMGMMGTRMGMGMGTGMGAGRAIGPSGRQRGRMTQFRAEAAAALYERRCGEVAGWLERALSLPRGSLGRDLGSGLGDGTVLLQLVVAIEPSLALRVRINCAEGGKQLSHFQKLENVTCFVNEAAALGVRCLFSPNDLVERRNLPAVVFAIYALARIAETRGFTGTPPSKTGAARILIDLALRSADGC
jgi:hypothetical protein